MTPKSTDEFQRAVGDALKTGVQAGEKHSTQEIENMRAAIDALQCQPQRKGWRDQAVTVGLLVVLLAGYAAITRWNALDTEQVERRINKAITDHNTAANAHSLTAAPASKLDVLTSRVEQLTVELRSVKSTLDRIDRATRTRRR